MSGYGKQEVSDKYYDQTFFKASNLKEITTSWTDVQSTGAKEYTEDSGKIDLYIPPNIAYFDPSQSYLNFDVELTDSDGTPIEPLRQGISSIIRSIRIYSAGAESQLLEEIDNYSLWTDILYSYTQNLVGDLDKKSMTELTKTWNYLNNPKDEIAYTPFFNAYDGSTGDFTTQRTPCKQTCNLYLNTGLFRNSEIFANNLVGGLRLEIQLRTTKESFIANINNRDVSTTGSRYYPLITGTLGSAQVVVGTAGFTLQNDLVKGYNATLSGFEYATIPFNMGQTIKLYEVDDTTKSSTLGSVNKMSTDGTFYKVEFSGTGTIHDDIAANNGILGVDASTIAGKYKLSNVSMKICEISPPQEWSNALMSMANSSQGYNYDIMTITNYQRSHNSGQTAITSYIPISNSRVKSIVSAPVPVETATYQNNTQKAQYDNYVDYQYFYMNQNHPNEAINLSRLSNNKPEALHLDQVRKSLEGCEYDIYNLREFKDCFVFGREVSYGNGSLNLGDGKDVMLKVNTTSAGLTKNTIFNHYVCSIRRIRVDSNGLQVFY